MHCAIYLLMGEIEKLPASDQQTKVVVAAGELHHGIAQMRSVAMATVATLKRYAQECFPETPNGKKHFARVIMECCAEELEKEFIPSRVLTHAALLNAEAIAEWEAEKRCVKCGDPLRGHEDENGTHCRFCVTCTDDGGVNMSNARASSAGAEGPTTDAGAGSPTAEAGMARQIP